MNFNTDQSLEIILVIKQYRFIDTDSKINNKIIMF